ncbi:hypothetical protein JTE90_007676 [Oedothorax gibbosus]|uniref:long-chain-fatty-acid--CoA ligase n=1 Tax=Oedothorax gibbosus TaxID=931172 RepID=A0AAV6UJG4_9ARAC|nr:hypothetical protein JTE90_007676 [Oedothorax gibbosus]
MSVRCAVGLLRGGRRRVLGGLYFCSANRLSYQFSRPTFKQKPVSLSQQSVLLPGPERIRSSQLLEDPNEPISQIPGSPEIETVFQVLEHGRQVSGDADCVGTKIPNTKEYKWLKYSEVISKSQSIGSGLIELGLSPCNDTFVGIYAANREEFLLTLYGCSAYSMVLVPLYVSFGLQSLLFIINQAHLSVVIVNNVENGLKILRSAEQLPTLQTVVTMDPPSPELEKVAKEVNLKLISFADLEKLGEMNKKELVLPKPDDLFCIPYTSGTTGVPKGAMLTHKNLISCVASLVVGYGDAGVFGGTIISLLPPAHIYEIANEVCSLYFARRIAFYSDDIKKLMDEVKILKPAILPFVPRILNAVYTHVMDSVKGSYVKSLLLKTALQRKKKLLQSGQVLTKNIWDKLILKKIQDALGGNCRMLITTSAPLSPEVMRFYRYALSSYVFEVYGQTEGMAFTMTLPEECEGGFVGPPLPCNFVKLVDVPEMGYYAKDDIGEVCVKGANVFKGYYKNEEASKESLIDGWQHTGDVGKWLPNGTLKIVDRKKHLFKLSQGEYIAPEKIENVYSRSKMVLQIFVDGLSDKDFVIVLVVPEPVSFQNWLKTKGCQNTEDLESIFSNKEIRLEFLKELHKFGKMEDLNRLEQARNLVFLPDPFTIENALLTPTLKVRRKQASKHYEETIRQMYKEGPLL